MNFLWDICGISATPPPVQFNSADKKLPASMSDWWPIPHCIARPSSQIVAIIVFIPTKMRACIDVPSTGRGGGLGKLAGSRSVDHGLLLCVFDSKSTEYQKSDGRGGRSSSRRQSKARAPTAQGKKKRAVPRLPTNAVCRFQYKSY